MKKYEWIPDKHYPNGNAWKLFGPNGYIGRVFSSERYTGVWSFYVDIVEKTGFNSINDSGKFLLSVAKEKAKTDQVSSSPSVSIPALPVGNAPLAPSK